MIEIYLSYKIAIYLLNMTLVKIYFYKIKYPVICNEHKKYIIISRKLFLDTNFEKFNLI